MVGAHDRRVNGCTFQSVLQCPGHHKIVNTPACVLLSGLEHIGPPGIDTLRIRVKIAEGVDVAALKHLVKAAPLLVRKTGIVAVCPGIFQIDFLVGNV